MGERSKIGLKRCQKRCLRQFSLIICGYLLVETLQNAPPCFCSHKSMMWKYGISKKIHSSMQLAYKDFLRMKFEAKMLSEECAYRIKEPFEAHLVIRNYCKIIGVANIISYTERMFYKSIELIQISIGKKLGREIANRNPARAAFTLSLSLSLSRATQLGSCQ